MTSKPTKNTQTTICTQMGTPRRGAGFVDSVIPFSQNQKLRKSFGSLQNIKAMEDFRSFVIFFSLILLPSFGYIHPAGLASPPRRDICLCFRGAFPHLKAAEEQKRAQQEGNHRNNIGYKSIGRLVQNARTIMLDEILLDLRFAFSICQHLTDQVAPLTARFRRANIQGRAFTDRTI